MRNGAQLIITNPDRTVPTETGIRAGAGAVQAFIEMAGGRTATVIGKPQPGIFGIAMAHLGLRVEETIMVGDTAETDIAGAEATGIRAVLVESGNINESDVQPILRVAGVAELLDRFREVDQAS